jgi:hypothetical protein
MNPEINSKRPTHSGFAPELSQDETHCVLAELEQALRSPRPPVPEDALRLLFEAACQGTGGSQAARNFLFWLAGQPDPTGFTGNGGLELRRLDYQLKSAALQVAAWWAGPTRSDMPLYELLGKLCQRFAPEDHD